MNNLNIIAETERTLPPMSFAENSVLSVDLPRDSVYRGLKIRLSGHVTTTFGSGTPVADAESTFSNLVKRINVIVNGSTYVKSVYPWLMHMQSLLAYKNIGERKSSAGAAAATGDNPTVDAGFTYGTTTQITTVAETIYVPFENIMCSPDGGGEATWLNLKGVASAQLQLLTNSFSKLLGFGNTAPVVFSASNLAFEVTTVEASSIDPNMYFSLWKQSTNEYTFAGEQSEFRIDINRGNYLQGLMFLCHDGAAGSATAATGKVLKNLVLKNIQLKLNGQVDLKTTSFLKLQAENRLRYGINAPLATNVSVFDGCAYLDLLTKGKLATAVRVQPPEVDNVQLSISTWDSTTCSYTNPVSVLIMTNEIVRP